MTDPPLPFAVSRYEALEEIARGPSGVAYRARDPLLDRIVVVKVVILPEHTPAKERAEIEARWLDEAQRASRLSHPGLASIHDSGSDPVTGAPFVIHELVAGTPLAKALVPGEPRPWSEALRVVGDVGRALQHLHGAGLVHGDVEPGNIVLQESGAPKLVFAAVPRAQTRRAGTAEVDAVLGNALYMSPEQAVGESADAQSDLFALGAVAYRLLTGCDAFEAEGSRKILARVLHDRPRSPMAIVSALPEGLDRVLTRALAKPRKSRYPNAKAFCDDLDDLLAGRAPANAPSSRRKEDTASFLATAGAEAPAGDGTGTGSIRLGRRPFIRGLVGFSALALIAGLEMLRRALERSDATPGARPAVDALPRPEETSLAKSASGLPSIEAAGAPLTRLSVDFRHTLETATLQVSVDGAKVVERSVRGAVKKSVLGIKLREGRLSQVVDVAPGRHEMTVKVSWGDAERHDKITGNFAAGATRRLSVKIGRIGKGLSVEWE